MGSTSNIIIPNIIPFELLGNSLFLIVFLLVLGFYAIFTGVLYYHWMSYSNNVGMTTLTFILYAALTVPMILTIATTTFII
jgi:hypothetical protein